MCNILNNDFALFLILATIVVIVLIFDKYLQARHAKTGAPIDPEAPLVRELVNAVRDMSAVQTEYPTTYISQPEWRDAYARARRLSAALEVDVEDETIAHV